MRIQMARLKWAMAAVVAALAVGGACDPLWADPAPVPSTVEDLPSLEKSLRELYAKVAPSTVNLFAEPKHEHVGSGVVIDAKGLVLTHAHQRHDPDTRFSVGLAPGTAVTAVFPDGKKALGKVLGVHEPFDLSLFQLEGGGPWPAVPLGDPARLKPGDHCVMLGYPKLHHREGQPPLLRLGRFLGPWGHYLLTSCNLNGGDSGGPLFTLDGKLLGNNNLCPNDRWGAGDTSVEYFQRIRPLLLEGRHIKKTDFNMPSGKYDYPNRGPFEGVTGLEHLVTPARDWVLTVLDGNKPVALGVVVDGNGWVVTKASELPVGDVECQLIDGRKVKAVVVGRERDHDLALLKLPIGNLSAAKWSDRPPAVGQVLAASGPAPQPLAVGVVASATRKVPSHDGLPSAFVFDGVVLRSECGGPLVGSDGKLAGLVIARIGPEKEKRTVLDGSRTYAIPADVVQQVVAALRKKADEQ
jgi:S1-C subfamily serine protease